MPMRARLSAPAAAGAARVRGESQMTVERTHTLPVRPRSRRVRGKFARFAPGPHGFARFAWVRAWSRRVRAEFAPSTPGFAGFTDAITQERLLSTGL